MRNLWFYTLIVVIWMLICYIGVGMWNQMHEKAVVSNSYYDWQALVDDEFVCIEQVEIERLFTYDEISLFIEQVSDGMFKEVHIDKNDKVHIRLKMYMQGKYFDELKKSYPEMDWVFGMISGLDMEIECMPSLDEILQLNIDSAKVGMIELPVSLFTILEEELQEIFEGVTPLIINEYQFQVDGLYIKGIVPLRIERNG